MEPVSAHRDIIGTVDPAKFNRIHNSFFLTHSIFAFYACKSAVNIKRYDSIVSLGSCVTSSVIVNILHVHTHILAQLRGTSGPSDTFFFHVLTILISADNL